MPTLCTVQPSLLIKIYFLSLFFLSLTHQIMAKETPVKETPMKETLSADEILERLQHQNMLNFEHGTANIEMRLGKKNADERIRNMTLYVQKNKKALLNTLIRFEAPADIAGTAFLVKQHQDGLPEQYVYVPATQVVRRIPASNASASFFGSDFLFIDLMPINTAQESLIERKRLDDATIANIETYTIELRIQEKASPYQRLILSIHKKEFMPVQIEFYDQNNQLLKTLHTQQLKKIKGKLVPVKLKMENHQQQTYTILLIKNIDDKTQLSDALFQPDTLKKN